MDRTSESAVTHEALRRYYPYGGLGRRFLPLPERSCIYVRNAKAGVTTTLLWLHRIHVGDHRSTPENVHTDHGLPTVADVGWDKVVAMLNGAAFRFSFVRDPIQRLESAYRDKVVRQRHPRERRTGIQHILGLPEDPDQVPTFDQFVAALEAQDPERMDVHWRPQYLNLAHPLVEYDLVGRVETFGADAARIRAATGIPDVPVEVQNVTDKSAAGLCDGRPGLLRKVRDIYARDFELYGY